MSEVIAVLNRGKRNTLKERWTPPLSVSPVVSAAPAGWEWHLLRDLATLESGHTPSRYRPDWWDGDVPWIALPDIRKLDGKTAFETAEYTNGEGISNSSARILPAGTVCLSRTASVGFVTKMGRPMATSQDFVNWVCGPNLDPDFLLYLLIASRDFIREQSSGAVHKTVYVPTAKEFRICCPPLAEQKRIAGILKEQLVAVELARGAAVAQLEAAKALPAAYLRDVYENYEGLGWPTERLGDLCTVVRGSSPRPKGDPRFYGTDVPRLMVEDCTRDGMHVTPKVDFLTTEGAGRSRPMKAGDVVIVVSGNPGLPAILAIDCCIHDGFVGLRDVDSERVENAYLYYFLLFNKSKTDADATGAIFRNLTTTQIRAIEVTLPPIDEQRRMVASLQDRAEVAKAIRTPLESQLTLIDSLPSSLLRSTFRGDL